MERNKTTGEARGAREEEGVKRCYVRQQEEKELVAQRLAAFFEAVLAALCFSVVYCLWELVQHAAAQPLHIC